jgi:hypothetical protein
MKMAAMYLFRRVKQPVLEANHSSPNSAQVKNVQIYTSILPHVTTWCYVQHTATLLSKAFIILYYIGGSDRSKLYTYLFICYVLNYAVRPCHGSGG